MTATLQELPLGRAALYETDIIAWSKDEEGREQGDGSQVGAGLEA